MHIDKYYRVPKVLLTDDYDRLTIEGVLLYALLLDRMQLSKVNATSTAWITNQGELYVYYQLEEIQRNLRCSHDKATKICRELELIGLIKRIPMGRGRPYRIVVYPPTLLSEKTAHHNAVFPDCRSDNIARSNTNIRGMTDISNVDPACQFVTTSWDATASFNILYTMYPESRRGDYNQGLAIYRNIVHEQEAAIRLQESLTAWIRSPAWQQDGGRYIPLLTNFLSRRYVDRQPPTAKPSPWGSGELGQEEIDAIHRLMRD